MVVVTLILIHNNSNSCNNITCTDNNINGGCNYNNKNNTSNNIDNGCDGNIIANE